jgi:hypothetical protein
MAKKLTWAAVRVRKPSRRRGLRGGVSYLSHAALASGWLDRKGYEHFFPLLVLPGPLLALALWRYRDPDAWFLVLTAMMPQRWFFDAFVLWLIPKSRREILFAAALSWGAGIWRWYHIPHTFTEVGKFTVLFIYLPMLAVILFRQGAREES